METVTFTRSETARMTPEMKAEVKACRQILKMKNHRHKHMAENRLRRIKELLQ